MSKMATLDAADLPELFLALPQTTFTFPLARLILEYLGANTAFGIAIWRIDSTIELPLFWMAEHFDDWARIAADFNLFQDKLLPPSTTNTNYGVLSSYRGPEITRDISAKWRKLFSCFAFVCERVYGTPLGAYCPRWDYTHFIRKWLDYQTTVCDELATFGFICLGTITIISAYMF